MQQMLNFMRKRLFRLISFPLALVVAVVILCGDAIEFLDPINDRLYGQIEKGMSIASVHTLPTFPFDTLPGDTFVASLYEYEIGDTPPSAPGSLVDVFRASTRRLSLSSPIEMELLG